MAKVTLFDKRHLIPSALGLMDLKTPRVMGILNLTPDSFYSEGRHQEGYLDAAREMIEHGADILDIGAQSTRPGATRLSADEEWNRMKEPLKQLVDHFPKTTFSIDTFHSEVARKAIDMGAHWINDITGGTLDDRMFRTAAELKVPYVLMHIQGTPETMQVDPHYSDVVPEVMKDLALKEMQLLDAGVNDIIIDPGFGFGKTVDQNFEILKDLGLFANFQRPILVGLSRKRMINQVLDITPDNALNGTTALNVLALERGADILRVHDVKEAVQAVRLVRKLQKTGT